MSASKVVGMRDDTAVVRHELEVDRLSHELAHEFDDVSPLVIEQGVRVEFGRRSGLPVQDFVSIFVHRTLREKLRTVASHWPPSTSQQRATSVSETLSATR